MERLRKLAFLPLLLACAVGTVAFAGEVLEQVPRDALGLIVVRNLSESDAKAGKLLTAVGSRMPGLLALLKSIAGLDAGLDQRRDLLIVLLPPQNNSRQFHLAVWLPVRDYDALVRSLDGDPERQVAAITLSGEDLLVVRQDNWAVVMDTDQRDRIELLQESKPSPPPQLAEWSEWIGTNDATVVVLPAGVRAAWAWAAESGLLQVAPLGAPAAQGDEMFGPPAPHDDDLFGPGNRRSPASGWAAVRQSIQSALAKAPELTRWAAEVEGFACGLRLDDNGNALVGVRVAVSPEAIAAANADTPPVAQAPAPRLYRDGPFVVTGGGQVSPHWIRPLVAPYVRQYTIELTTQYNKRLPPEDLSSLSKSIESAAVDVSAFAVLTRPGTDADGVYTNYFLAVRVPSSKEFLQRVGSLVDEWNAIVGKDEALKPLAFASSETTVDGHRGREYAIDMNAAAGVPPLPENKATMERLFGPGGKFSLQALALDEQNVLLAVATQSQVKELVEALKDADATEPQELQAIDEIFTANNKLQLYLSPRGYTEWLRREFDAVFGDAIGAPTLPLYPESPPIGVAAGRAGRVLWTEVAVPAEALRGFAKFSRN